MNWTQITTLGYLTIQSELDADNYTWLGAIQSELDADNYTWLGDDTK